MTYDLPDDIESAISSLHSADLVCPASDIEDQESICLGQTLKNRLGNPPATNDTFGALANHNLAICITQLLERTTDLSEDEAKYAIVAWNIRVASSEPDDDPVTP